MSEIRPASEVVEHLRKIFSAPAPVAHATAIIEARDAAVRAKAIKDVVEWARGEKRDNSGPVCEVPPCPFCGGEGQVNFDAPRHHRVLPGVQVKCEKCGASGPRVLRDDYYPEQSKTEAIAAWSTRATPTPPADAVELAARAMCAEGGFDPDEIMPNDGLRWKYYVPGAQAALAAGYPPLVAENKVLRSALDEALADDECLMDSEWRLIAAKLVGLRNG